MTHRSDRRPDTPMISAAATPCRLTYGNRARGFHQGQSNQLLANRPVIVTQSFLCSSALQFRGSPYSSHSAARFLRRLQCAVRPGLWKLNRVSQPGKHVFSRECLAQAQKCRLPSAVSWRDVLHLPFLAQRFGDALNFRLLRQHEMQATKNTVHAILDRTRRCKNVLDARMGTSDD